MYQFQHSEYFISLLAVPLLVYLFYRIIKWKERVAAKIGDPELVKNITGNYSPNKFRTKFILFTAAFVLCIVALAGFVKPDTQKKVQRKGTDIIIALDVSRSMLASDMKPNRLERARQFIYKVIENSPNDRIGIVIFAGRAYLQMPLTLDHAAAKMYIASTSPDDVPTQGTVLHYALQMSGNAFSPNDKTFKSVLLISDGEDHDKNAVKEAAKLFKQGIIVNTVGIGSVSGSPILDEKTGQYKVDENGNTVISRLNEQELMSIADAGHGIYQLFSSPVPMVAALRQKLDEVSSDSIISDASFSSYIQYFQYFLAAALLLLVIEFFTSEKRKKQGNKLMTTMLFISLSFTATAQKNKDKIVEGNRAYIENRFDEAEKSYQEALQGKGDHDIVQYNLGNTLYRKNKADEAVKAFDEVIGSTRDEELKQKAFYNKGVTYQRANELDKSITAYKNALILNPNDEAARQNLQRVLKKKEEQQKQQQQQQDQKKQQQQQKEQKNQPKQEDQKQQSSKLSREQAEEKLKALLEKEKNLQEKLKKVKGVEPNNPEKDW